MESAEVVRRIDVSSDNGKAINLITFDQKKGKLLCISSCTGFQVTEEAKEFLSGLKG
jgi:hypothetical protein